MLLDWMLRKGEGWDRGPLYRYGDTQNNLFDFLKVELFCEEERSSRYNRKHKVVLKTK